MDNGVIDITELADFLRASSVKIELSMIVALISATGVGAAIMAMPVVGQFCRWIINAILTAASYAAYRLMFYADTAIRKATEAHSYVDAKKKLDDPNLSDAEYKKYEEIEMAEFKSLVMATK